MAVAVRFCGRCGAQLAPGAAFCGRCGTPQIAQAVAPAPVYNYPIAYPAPAYLSTRQFNLSQIAVAGGLLIILAIVTVAISVFAVTHVFGGRHAACTADCAPKIGTPLPESNMYRSTAYGYEVDYFASWTVRSQDASGVTLGTKVGLVQVVGMRASQPLDVTLQGTVSALPTAQWQDVAQVSTLKGAHIGDQDGIGAIYSANLVGASSTATKVRFAVIVATRAGVSVVVFVADPADPKNSPNGIPEGQEFDYLCSEFRWAS